MVIIYIINDYVFTWLWLIRMTCKKNVRSERTCRTPVYSGRPKSTLYCTSAADEETKNGSWDSESPVIFICSIQSILGASELNERTLTSGVTTSVCVCVRWMMSAPREQKRGEERKIKKRELRINARKLSFYWTALLPSTVIKFQKWANLFHLAYFHKKPLANVDTRTNLLHYQEQFVISRPISLFCIFSHPFLRV